MIGVMMRTIPPRNVGTRQWRVRPRPRMALGAAASCRRVYKLANERGLSVLHKCTAAASRRSYAFVTGRITDCSPRRQKPRHPAAVGKCSLWYQQVFRADLWAFYVNLWAFCGKKRAVGHNSGLALQ